MYVICVIIFIICLIMMDGFEIPRCIGIITKHELVEWLCIDLVSV